MNAKSIRFRLTAWYAGVLAALVLLLGGILFLPLRRSIDRIVLQTDARRARQIGESLVGPAAGAGGEAGLAATVERIYAPARNSRFIRISRRDGSVLYRSGVPDDQGFNPGGVPPTEPWPKSASMRRESLPEGGALLLAAFRTAPQNGVSYLVEVGTSARGVDQMLSRFWLIFAGAIPLALLVAVGGGYFLVSRALRPVDEMARKAEVITQHNLGERLPVAPAGDELQRLAEALNHMITRLQDALANSKRFVADASHELRTPLTVLQGELEALAQDARLPAEMSDRLGSLLEETERLSQIVERLLVLSRLDAGEAQAESVRFDLAQMAASTVEQMSLLAEDRGIQVSCVAGGPVEVEGDRARLKQVVVNLLDNAIKYTGEGGTVRLEVTAAGGRAVLEVTDTGIGITPEALPHVFERFYRADASRSREPDGAGLGLAIIRSICHAHGGDIEVESVVGRGSTFRVHLPSAA